MMQPSGAAVPEGGQGGPEQLTSAQGPAAEQPTAAHGSTAGQPTAPHGSTAQGSTAGRPTAAHGSTAERRRELPGFAPVPQTRQQAQAQLVVEHYEELGHRLGAGPVQFDDDGVHYLFRRSHLLVRDEYLPAVRALLTERIGEPLREGERSLVRGVTLLQLPENAATIDALRLAQHEFGAGVVAPDHMVSISGAGGMCPANEAEVVPPGSAPDPVGEDRSAGTGIRVVVVDTGLDPAAPAAHRWMRGVTGDPDPAIQPPRLLKYAGHGTFVAGVIRSVAPQAEVIVRAIFGQAGAIFESDLVDALDRVLEHDHPDVICMSAGTWTFDSTGLLGLGAFYEHRMRHHKGVVLVAAAGNDSSRRPFWPAAAPWAISVGALATDWRSRAEFTNFGGWVDVYAPGEHLVNAFPSGDYTYQEPPRAGEKAHFTGMACWSGTSFATPVVAGMIASRMASRGENGQVAAEALLAQARAGAIPGVGAVLLPR